MSSAYTVGSLCTGYGGVELALAQVMDVRPVWFAEIDPAASQVLAHRFPQVPNHGDLTTVNWSEIEPVQILTAGFPCQDVSSAGRRAGLRDGNRSGLWFHIANIVNELRPPLVVLENVRGLLNASADSALEPCPWCVGDGPATGLRALGAVLGDLADLGFDAEWGVFRASDVGAPHRRERVFVVAADPGSGELQRWGVGRVLAGAEGARAGEGLQRQWVRDTAGDGRAAPADPTDSGQHWDRLRARRRRAGSSDGRGTVADTGCVEGRPACAAVRAGGGGTDGIRAQEPRRRGGAAADAGRERVQRGSIAGFVDDPAEAHAGKARRGDRSAAAGGCGPASPHPESLRCDGCYDGHPQATADPARTERGDQEQPDLGTVAGPAAEPRKRASDPSAHTDGVRMGSEQQHHLRHGGTPRGADPAGRVLDWAGYEFAIRRWERVLGRLAPAPTVLGTRSGQQLNPHFVEWLMGLPDGWVTDVPGLSRNQMLRLLGNGVVPQQCAAAVTHLLPRLYEQPPLDRRNIA